MASSSLLLDNRPPLYSPMHSALGIGIPTRSSRILLGLVVYCPYSTIQLYSHTVPYSRTVLDLVVPVPYSTAVAIQYEYGTIQYSCTYSS
eukprot:COSAG05_NODE_1325_length_5180_cov_5.433576_2_plen_90_part_00